MLTEELLERSHGVYLILVGLQISIFLKEVLKAREFEKQLGCFLIKRVMCLLDFRIEDFTRQFNLHPNLFRHCEGA